MNPKMPVEHDKKFQGQKNIGSKQQGTEFDSVEENENIEAERQIDGREASMVTNQKETNNVNVPQAPESMNSI